MTPEKQIRLMYIITHICAIVFILSILTILISTIGLIWHENLILMQILKTTLIICILSLIGIKLFNPFHK